MIEAPGPGRLLAAAHAELGTVEKPRGSNRTKYGAWYRQNGVPWCDIFVSYVAVQAGLGDVIWRSSYVPARLERARDLGQVVSSPRAGDLAIFWFGPDSTPDHIGIVESVPDAQHVVTIEGNTAPGSAGSQSNGGGVYRRTRARSLIRAYIRPPYTAAAVTPAKPTPQEDDMPLTRADVDMLLSSKTAVYKVKDGAEQVGLTDAATRILAAVRRLEASAIDPEVLAASIARHLPAGVDANRIAADVAADLIARLKA